MAIVTRPDGTRVEGKYLRVEFADGTKVEASDEEFSLNQSGRSISIPCGPKLFMEILRLGRQPEEVLYAIISSPEGQEIARAAIEQCLMMRSEGQPPAMFEGYIING